MSSYLLAGRNGKQPWPAKKVLGFVALPAMVVLTGASTPWAVNHIEDRLEGEARQNLIDAGIDPSGLDIDFDYRDGEARGVLPAGATVEGIESSADAGIVKSFNVVTGDAEGASSAVTITSTPTTALPAPSSVPPTTAPATTAPATTVASVPVEVTATASGDGRVVLDGVVSTAAQRDELVAAAETAFGVGNVADQLRVSDAPAAIDGADARVGDLAATFSGLSALDAGTASLSGSSIDVTGAGDADAAAALEAAVGAFSTDGALALEVSDPEADAAAEEARLLAEETELLQEELDALQAEIRETVTFATGSAILRRPAAATIDKIADAMNRYQRPVVEIGGHTDDVGNADSNRALSRERADAVVAALVDRGIPADRLNGVGYGPDSPIADNGTDAGRQENRRVEANALERF